MKKLLIVLISALTMSAGLCSCSNIPGMEGEKPSSEVNLEESVESTMSFVDNGVRVELYENVQLTVQGVEKGKTLTWRSANPEKLTIDENGVAYAKMAGPVTVYVSDGISEISCTVTVINSGLIPLIAIDLPSTFTLSVGDAYNLTPYVIYNSVKYYDAQYVYTAEGSVSVSSEGVITANSVGKGKVTVTASWRNAQAKTLTMEFEVSVIA